MKTLRTLIFLAAAAAAAAADMTADISVTFAPMEGPPVSAEVPHAGLDAVTTIPLDVPGALRLVEISPVQDKGDETVTRLNIVLRDPGTILPGTPGTGSFGPIQPQALVIAQAVVKMTPDQPIVFLKTPSGTWSVRLSSISKP
jgi:hypothetical protein